ncbi:hypothetical protein ACFFU1_04090 [Algibacter miyuki]|uniref:Uncharacterized protein n=1 Tax=Algibacter miyuki TaxID=1306933 RepID=A0ABV5GWN5_9FLAO|nr:hypothetical protein [Algibacter miyuki]MDN3664308.1 hypothetical protein [Algibacter miyuki]
MKKIYLLSTTLLITAFTFPQVAKDICSSAENITIITSEPTINCFENEGITI